MSENKAKLPLRILWINLLVQGLYLVAFAGSLILFKEGDFMGLVLLIGIQCLFNIVMFLGNLVTGRPTHAGLFLLSSILVLVTGFYGCSAFDKLAH